MYEKVRKFEDLLKELEMTVNNRSMELITKIQWPFEKALNHLKERFDVAEQK